MSTQTPLRTTPTAAIGQAILLLVLDPRPEVSGPILEGFRKSISAVRGAKPTRRPKPEPIRG